MNLPVKRGSELAHHQHLRVEAHPRYQRTGVHCIECKRKIRRLSTKHVCNRVRFTNLFQIYDTFDFDSNTIVEVCKIVEVLKEVPIDRIVEVPVEKVKQIVTLWVWP